MDTDSSTFGLSALLLKSLGEKNTENLLGLAQTSTAGI